MPTLNLYDGREPHIIKVKKNGKPFELKIPVDPTIEDLERLYELQVKIDELAEQGIEKDRFETMFEQLRIIFCHYHPDITIEELKKYLGRKGAIEVLNFFHAHNFAVKGMNPDGSSILDEKKNQNL